MKSLIEKPSGNILEASTEAIVNTVNTVGVMGKGIALQFKRAFPEMFQAYEIACKRKEIVIGKMHVYDRGLFETPRYIINFPTKNHWRSKSQLSHIVAGLRDLVLTLRRLNIKSISIPPLGCGNGGLDWSKVLPIIERTFQDVNDIEVAIYAPNGPPKLPDQINRTKRPIMNASRASVIRILSQYSVLGYRLTLIEAQKLLYFLQTAGEPLRLNYAKERYGPYADNLRHVLNRFEGHFTKGFGDGVNSPSTIIQLLPEAIQEAEVFAEKDNCSSGDSLERLARVSELIKGYESPYGLELLASVHWMATRTQTKMNDLPSLIKEIHNWSDRKRKIMKAEHIQKAWERLRKFNWI